ncbi:hypothetical protein BJ165DRAFT_1118371 [Panaeolus papilionaceus]|nr:hypothetical protein BJ165DRAFT_1118371 [Panaeolus papilionaceus]
MLLHRHWASNSYRIKMILKSKFAVLLLTSFTSVSIIGASPAPAPIHQTFICNCTCLPTNAICPIGQVLRGVSVCHNCCRIAS